MELINRMMIVSESPITEDDRGVKRFVICKDGDKFVFRSEHNHIAYLGWLYAQEIPKKTKRMMNNEEIIDLIKENPHVRVTRTEGIEDYGRSIYVLDGIFFKEIDSFSYTLDFGETFKDFYIEVES